MKLYLKDVDNSRISWHKIRDNAYEFEYVHDAKMIANLLKRLETENKTVRVEPSFPGAAYSYIIVKNI